MNYYCREEAGNGNDDDDALLSDEEEEVDPYDEDLFIDEEDRQRLMAMTEVEREPILYMRSEERREIQERNKLRRELRAQRLKERGITPPPTTTPTKEKKSA